MAVFGKQRYITPGLILISAVSLAAFVFVYSPSRFHTEFDDSYMYCRYASNFLSGHGFSWNAQDGPSFGATSPAYLVLVTTLKRLFHPENPVLLSAASFSAGLAGLLILACTGYLVGGGARRLAFLLVIPLILISSSFRFHSFTGMETTLSFASNALLILSVLLYGRKPGAVSFAAVLLCSVFTFTVRPDNGVYALVFPALFLLAGGRIKAGKALFLAGLFAASVGMLLLVYSGLFGTPLPVPFYTKSGGYFQGYAGAANWNAAGYILTFLRDTSPFTAVVILFAGRKRAPELLEHRSDHGLVCQVLLPLHPLRCSVSIDRSGRGDVEPNPPLRGLPCEKSSGSASGLPSRLQCPGANQDNRVLEESRPGHSIPHSRHRFQNPFRQVAGE